MKNKKTKKYLVIILFMIIVSLGFLGGSFLDVFADEICDSIEECDKVGQVYKQIIEIKQKTANSLNNQISSMNNNIVQLQTEIEKNKDKIENLSEQIERKSTEIDFQEDSISSQKKLLGGLVKLFYEQQQQNVLATFLTDENIQPFMSNKDSLSQTSVKIRELLENMKALKQKTEEEKEVLEKNKEEVSILHADLKDKNSDIEDAKESKTILLTKTQGEEAKYQKLLEKVEKQKLELMNLDELYLASGISVSEFNKPPSSLNASTSWYYSQKDSSWANTKIGNSKSLMKDYGCAVASLAMVFTEHGDKITPKTLAKKPIFSWDLIAWPSNSMPDGKVKMSSYGFSHGNVSLSIIDNEIKKGNPVIVYIKKTSGSGGHYVVIHNKDKKEGDYVVHDPYFGANLYLKTSMALVGKLGINSGTKLDQMIIYK